MEEQPLDYDGLGLEPGDDDMDLPTTREQIIEILENADVPDEMKEKLRSLYGGGEMPKLFGYGSGTFLAVVFVVLIFSIILFFGYKLYKSIKDKELKKEEKKKLKQMKKKK